MTSRRAFLGVTSSMKVFTSGEEGEHKNKTAIAQWEARTSNHWEGKTSKIFLFQTLIQFYFLMCEWCVHKCEDPK